MTEPGLYVHIPFCLTKCPYCDFYSCTDCSGIPLFLDALEIEIQLCRDEFSRFDSLYLGGGTPSALDDRQFTSLLEMLLDGFKFSPDTEITVEANPEDITPDKLKLLKELGVNRLSLGAQSFNANDLRFLKRRHSAGKVREAIEQSRAAGFGNLGLDLIYGLQTQDEKKWLENIRQALSFRPEHISCYQLTFAPGTKFDDMRNKDEITPISEDNAANLFQVTSQLLEDAGYIHYEISNFAREEVFFSRHNQKYWEHSPYLGLGPSAHSFNKTRRWWNHRSVRDYTQSLAERRKPVQGWEDLSNGQILLEKLLLGLRTKKGVSYALVKEISGIDDKLKNLADHGLATVSGGWIKPTIKGFLVADRLPLWLAD